MKKNIVLLILIFVSINSFSIEPQNTSIYNIQYTTNSSGDSPLENQNVTTKGIITAIDTNGSNDRTFYIQDSSKAWNGIYIYDNSGIRKKVGDSVEITGTVNEHSGYTRIESVTNINIINSGNTLPSPIVIATKDAKNEKYEGVLIKVMNAKCTKIYSGNGIWKLNLGVDSLKVDDDLFSFTPTVGIYYDVTGIVNYSSNEYIILPRYSPDIQPKAPVVNISDRNEESSYIYPNPANEYINFVLSRNNTSITIMDITGKIVNSFKADSKKISIKVSDLSEGMYFYKVVSESEIIKQNRFIIMR